MEKKIKYPLRDCREGWPKKKNTNRETPNTSKDTGDADVAKTKKKGQRRKKTGMIRVKQIEPLKRKSCGGCVFLSGYPRLYIVQGGIKKKNTLSGKGKRKSKKAHISVAGAKREKEML